MTTVSDLYNDLRILEAAQAKCAIEFDAARDRFNAIDPPVPQEIVVGSVNDFIFLDRQWFRPPWPIKCERRVVYAEGWRAMLSNPPLGLSSGQPIPEAVERMRAGLAAAEIYEAQRAEARRASGYEAAEAADNAASEAVWAMQKAIAAAAPATMADVRLKAEVVLGWLGDDESDACLAALLKSLADLPTSAAA